LARAELDLVECALEDPEVRRSLRRELDTALRAPEEFCAQPFLQSRHVAADRALGHEELLRGAREARVAGGGFERTQRVQRWELAVHRLMI
jgi:hypothetical protein